MPTTIEIARPKCNNFANCCLIFAVDEGPADNISAIGFWVLDCSNGVGDLVLVVRMLLCGPSQPCRATSVAAVGWNLGWFAARFFTSENPFGSSTVSAAEESPAGFGSVTYDL
jgi:hypothetical protein